MLQSEQSKINAILKSKEQESQQSAFCHEIHYSYLFFQYGHLVKGYNSITILHYKIQPKNEFILKDIHIYMYTYV